MKTLTPQLCVKLPIGTLLALILAGNLFAGDPPPMEAALGIPLARIKQSVITCPGEEIALDGWASIDVGGEIVEWQWDLTGDRRVDTTSPNGSMVYLAPEKSGSSIIYLFVKDNKGNISAPDSATVHVMSGAPRVVMGGDTTIPIMARINFNPRIETTCGKLIRYEWDFNDDGVPEYKSDETAKTSRVYNRAGKYQVRLKVVDSFGKEAGGIRSITVNAAR